MEEISKKKKKNDNETYSIRAVIDVRRKVIRKILTIEQRKVCGTREEAIFSPL